MVHAVALLVEAHATNRKVAGSIADEVTGYFIWPNSPSCRPWGSIQPLTEMSNRTLPEGTKGGGAWG
jgi:hypothetical protein